MKTAFSSWKNRIAPVFDVTRQIFLVESVDGKIIFEEEKGLPGEDLGEKALHLAGMGVNTLVCGAISQFMQSIIASYGINVVPFIAGDLREVIQAWFDNRIKDDVFAMPGCCQEGKRSRLGSTGVRAGRGRCVTGGAPGAGSGGICICPQCFHQEPHVAGIPCSRKLCPVCGCTMARG